MVGNVIGVSVYGLLATFLINQATAFATSFWMARIDSRVLKPLHPIIHCQLCVSLNSKRATRFFLPCRSTESKAGFPSVFERIVPQSPCLGGTDKGWLTLDGQEGDFILKHARNVPGAKVMPERQSFSDRRAKARTKAVAHTPANRLKDSKTRAALGEVDACTFQRAVVLSQEGRRVAFPCSHCRGHVRANISFTRVVLIVPSCVLGPCGRPGFRTAGRLFFRIRQRVC